MKLQTFDDASLTMMLILSLNSDFIHFVIHVLVHSKHFAVIFALHGFHDDSICIQGVEDKDVFVSPGRCLRKLPHEVRVSPSLFLVVSRITV